MPIVVESFLEHFDHNFQSIKMQVYQQAPREYPLFLKEETTDRAFVKRSYMGGLGLPRRNRDMERIPMDRPVKGPTAFYIPVTYRLGYSIERQVLEDELFGELGKRPLNMVQSSVTMMDIVGADILNNGATLQSYDFGGLPLFSASHNREDGLDTWSNHETTQLPITVETVFQIITEMLYNIKDTRGYPIPYNGTYRILVPSINPTLWRQAVEVVNAVMNPNTADNRPNALKTQFNVSTHACRFLTNPNRWFIAWDTSAPNYGLTMMTRVSLNVTPLTPYADNPDAWYSRSRQRFVAGYEHKRGIVAVG